MILHGLCSNKDWPLYVVVKRDNDEDHEFRRYKRRSDYQISISSLPRLLVEVKSTPGPSWPMDLIHMLTTGAYVVRLANKSYQRSERRRISSSAPSLFGMMATQLVMFYFSSLTTTGYVVFYHSQTRRLRRHMLFTT